MGMSIQTAMIIGASTAVVATTAGLVHQAVSDGGFKHGVKNKSSLHDTLEWSGFLGGGALFVGASLIGPRFGIGKHTSDALIFAGVAASLAGAATRFVGATIGVIVETSND